VYTRTFRPDGSTAPSAGSEPVRRLIGDEPAHTTKAAVAIRDERVDDRGDVTRFENRVVVDEVHDLFAGRVDAGRTLAGEARLPPLMRERGPVGPRRREVGHDVRGRVVVARVDDEDAVRNPSLRAHRRETRAHLGRPVARAENQDVADH
jgi:hypothetical protein